MPQVNDPQTENPSRVTRYANWILKRRWFVLAATLAVIAAAASGAGNLYFNAGYRIWFAPDNPQLAAFDQIEKTYTKNDNVLIALAPGNGEVFTQHNLQALNDLTDLAWRLPYAIRVDALGNFQRTTADGDDLLVRDLVESPQGLSAAELEDIRRVALSEPALANRLITEQTVVTGVNVTLQYPEDNPEAVSEVAVAAEALRAEMRERYPDATLYMTGIAMINNAFSEAGKKDMSTLTPLMYLAMLLALFFAMRTVSGTFATLLVLTFSMVSAMGIAGWLGVGLTPMSLTAPTIIMTLAIADCVHIVVTALRERRKGKSKHDAIVESLRLNLLPVFLTSLTTVIGFLSLNWIKVPPINHLGNITAVGVMLAFVFSVTTLPALLSVLPLKARAKRVSQSAFFERWAKLIIAHRTAALWGSAVVVVGLAALIPSNELNDRFTEYFDETIRFRVENDFIAENLTSAYQIEYSLGAAGSGGVQDPGYLHTVERFADWWRENPQVSHVATITDVMKRLNMNMHGDDSAFYRLPDNRELAAQYLLLYEMSLPYGLDLNNQINVDKSASRFVITLAGNVSAKDLREISRAGEQWLVHNAPTHMQASASSPPIMFAYISQIALNNMLVGTTLALILVSSVILIALRSFRIGMLSLVPNLVPVGIGFGVWALINGEINMGMAPVVGMTLGIVVDDTIHFLSKYLRGRRESGLQAPEAVSYAFTTVGPALVITTVTLVLGFAILSLSSFSVNADMALMTAITIAAALVADFIFLPALLLKTDSAPALELNQAATGRQGTPVPLTVQAEN